MRLEVQDWGTCEYTQALARQKHLLAARIQGLIPDTLVLVEHPPVFTIGKQGSVSNILVPRDSLSIPVHHVERGGDITYHGPGQIVAYPIFALPLGRRDVKAFIRMLEDVLVATCRVFGARAVTIEGLTGVWVASDNHLAHRHEWHGERKIASIGCAFKRWVSYHGIALNVTTDLVPFSYINLCGLPGKQPISLIHCATRPVTLAAVKRVFISLLEDHWHAYCSCAPRSHT